MINILLVEDNAAECAGLRMASLKLEGNAITTVAGTAAEARRLVREQKFDAVVVDLELRDGDGAAFITELPALCPVRMPFILAITRTKSEALLNTVRTCGAYIITKQNRMYSPQYVLQTVMLFAPFTE